MVKSAGRRSLPKFQKQFKQQRWLKRLNIQPTKLARILIHSRFVYTVRYIPNRIQDSVKFRKRNFKSCARTVHVLSNMKNVAFSRCCFVTFYKQRQRNEQRIITHACTAIVLVAVKLCLIKLSKIE